MFGIDEYRRGYRYYNQETKVAATPALDIGFPNISVNLADLIRPLSEFNIHMQNILFLNAGRQI